MPIFSLSTALRGDTATSVTARGSVATPASSGEYPRTNWRNCVRRKRNPNITKKANVMTPEPIEKPGLRKYFIGSIGYSWRNSQSTNPTSENAATTNAMATSVLVQPLAGPSMIP
jgi:hypothetical protein